MSTLPKRAKTKQDHKASQGMTFRLRL